MSQTLNERLILSKHHDPRHFSLESYEYSERGDRWVGLVAVVLGVVLMVVW